MAAKKKASKPASPDQPAEKPAPAPAKPPAAAAARPGAKGGAAGKAPAAPPRAKPPSRRAQPAPADPVEHAGPPAAPEAPAKAAPAKPAPAKAGPAAPKAAPKPAPKPPTKPATKPAPKPAPRSRGADLDDLDGPDDDDLEDEDRPRRPPPRATPEAADGVGGEEAEPGDEEEAAPAAAAAAGGEPAAKKPAAPRPVPPMPARKPGVITFAFSPDADDAFMVYALAHGKVETEDRRYELIRSDIARLNEEATKGTYDVTAFSFGAWPSIVERYFVLPCGGSFGDQVGPVVVSKTPVRSSEVNGLTVAVPGLNTTATLVLRLWLHPNRLTLVNVPFDQVMSAVKAGKARAGLLIHEGQLTYKAEGLTRVMDLGQWWGEKTEGLPLPLGGNAIRRDLPPEERTKIQLDLKRSIAYALGHREEALEYAAPFGRGLPKPLLEKYVSTYVNELTLDFGERGRQAVHALYDEAVRLRLLKQRVDLEFP